MIRKFVTVAALLGFGLTATACNTVKGLGQDIQSAGECGEDVLDGDKC